MYEYDSFFTLSVMGQVGLTVLSIGLGILLVGLVRWMVQDRPMALRLVSAVLALWLFIWLSPQIYYLYYMLLFDGLVFKSVLSSPPSLAKLFEVLFLRSDSTLSNHGKTLLGWILIISSLVRRTPRNR